MGTHAATTTCGREALLQALHSILSAQAQARALLRSHPNRTQLTKQLGISPRTLRRYTHGHRPIPPDLLPRILTPSSPQPRRKPREAAGTRTRPEHPSRRTTQGARAGRWRSRRGAGSEDEAATREDAQRTYPKEGPPEKWDRSGGPAGRARSDHQRRGRPQTPRRRHTRHTSHHPTPPHPTQEPGEKGSVADLGVRRGRCALIPGPS